MTQRVTIMDSARPYHYANHNWTTATRDGSPLQETGTDKRDMNNAIYRSRTQMQGRVVATGEGGGHRGPSLLKIQLVAPKYSLLKSIIIGHTLKNLQ